MKKFCTFLLLILFLFLTVFGFSACNFLSYDTKENNSSISVKNDFWKEISRKTISRFNNPFDLI